MYCIVRLVGLSACLWRVILFTEMHHLGALHFETYRHYQHVSTIRPNIQTCFICFFLFELRKWLKWLKWNFLFVPHFQTWKASKGQTVLVGACVWAITLPVVHKGSGQSTAWKRYGTCDMHITWMILHDHVSQHLFEACLKTSEEYGKCSRNDQFIENLLGRYLTSVFKKRSLQPCGRNIQEAPPVGMFNKYMFWKCARVQSVGGSVFTTCSKSPRGCWWNFRTTCWKKIVAGPFKRSQQWFKRPHGAQMCGCYQVLSL